MNAFLQRCLRLNRAERTLPHWPRVVLSRREYQRRVNLRRATHQWALRQVQVLPGGRE